MYNVKVRCGRVKLWADGRFRQLLCRCVLPDKFAVRRHSPLSGTICTSHLVSGGRRTEVVSAAGDYVSPTSSPSQIQCTVSSPVNTYMHDKYCNLITLIGVVAPTRDRQLPYSMWDNTKWHLCVTGNAFRGNQNSLGVHTADSFKETMIFLSARALSLRNCYETIN